MLLQKETKRLAVTAFAAVLVSLPLVACQQENPASEVPSSAVAARAQLKEGPVWVKTASRVTYDVKGSYNSSGETFENFELDEAGNVKVQHVRSDDEEFTQTFERNEDGWMTKEVYAADDGSVDTIEYTNKYDENGRLIQNNGNDITEDVAYDENGRVLERKYTKFSYVAEENFAPIGGSEYEVNSTMAYNTDGTIKSRYSSLRFPMISEYHYEYDAKGRPVSCVVSSYEANQQGERATKEGSVTKKISIFYDDNGNIARIESEGEQGKTVEEYEYALIEHPSLAVRTTARLLTLS